MQYVTLSVILIAHITLYDTIVHTSMYTQCDWPQSLKDYSELCSGGTLTVHRSPPDWVQRSAVVVDASIRRGMSTKKLHEVIE